MNVSGGKQRETRTRREEHQKTDTTNRQGQYVTEDAVTPRPPE